MTTSHDIPALAAELAAAFPNFDEAQQRLAVTIYRLLSRGRPVAPDELANSAGRSVAEVAAFLDDLPTLYRDEQERLIAYGGLTLEPTSHVLELDGRTVYTWCALDTLFVPALLGQKVRVRSKCPETGQQVSLTVDPTGVYDVNPQSAVISLHDIRGLDLRNVVGTFCCFVHFFASEQAAHAWTTHREGTYVVTIAQGFEYGRLFVRDQYGKGLQP